MTAAENAIRVLVTIPNLDVFISLSLSSVWFVSSHTWRWLMTAVGKRSKQLDTSGIHLWFWDWSLQGAVPVEWEGE